MQFTKEELDAVLEKHRKWLRSEEGWERARLGNVDLSDADLSFVNLSFAYLINTSLRGANLSFADLRNAYLSNAYITGANLSFARLDHADLSGADLVGANLRSTNLIGANLIGADLSGADLGGADLSGANLSGANLSGVRGLPPICCPEEGSFIGWKKCVSPSFMDGIRIVKLLIPEDARRSSATGRKCRCDKALVLGIYDLDGNRLPDDLLALSSYDTKFKYRVGETVSVPDFDENRWNECAPGIHFFITRQEAIDY